MKAFVVFCAATLIAAGSPATATRFERETFKVRTVQMPLLDVDRVDYGALTVEVAHDVPEIGEPQLRATKTWCMPNGSKNLKDAVEVPTHYYEIPHHTGGAVIVVRSGDGSVVHSERLDPHDGQVRFGYDECRYWLQPRLDEDWAVGMKRIPGEIDNDVRALYRAIAERTVDEALFAAVREDKIPLFSFRDKRHDYQQENTAAEDAATVYRELNDGALVLGSTGHERLEASIARWTEALDQADMQDKQARISRKVAARLHANVGVAKMMMGETVEAKRSFETSSRMWGATVSRSNGTGNADLLARIGERRQREARQSAEAFDAEQIQHRLDLADRYRGKIPFTVYGGERYETLSALHLEQATVRLVQDIATEKATDEGVANRYENQVMHTSTQGFVLFLMPYGNKLDTFPEEILELTHLNRLRAPGHGIERLPDDIGQLSALEVLDLSSNRIIGVPGNIGQMTQLRKLDLANNQIERLPDEIGRLQSLKSLTLKGNPISDQELSRIRSLLPNCKIKM